MLPADLPEVPSDEAPVRQLGGLAGRVALVLSVGLSLYALYWVLFIVQPQIYRVSFLLVALVLTFLLFPVKRAATFAASSRARLGCWSR